MVGYSLKCACCQSVRLLAATGPGASYRCVHTVLKGSLLKVSVNIGTDYHEQKMVPQKIFTHTFKAESYVGLVPKDLDGNYLTTV